MKRKLHVVYCNLPQLLTNFNEFSEIYNYFVKREANSSKKGYCTRVKLSCNIPFSIKFMYGGEALYAIPELEGSKLLRILDVIVFSFPSNES